jgi:hypothetical protein
MNEQNRNQPTGEHRPNIKAEHRQDVKAEHRHDVKDTNPVHLVTQLTREVAELFTKEVALAKSELSQSFQQAKTGIGSVASGGMVLFAGFLVLLIAAVIGLAEFMAPWLAAIIVGGVVCLIGFSMVKAGQQKLEPSAFKPERTAHSLQKDKEAAKNRHHSRGATT